MDQVVELQAALDAQALVIENVRAEVLELKGQVKPDIDLRPVIEQVRSQTAALEALFPAPAPAPQPAEPEIVHGL